MGMLVKICFGPKMTILGGIRNQIVPATLRMVYSQGMLQMMAWETD